MDELDATSKMFALHSPMLSTVAIAAAIIAAVRLARDNIDGPSARVIAAVGG